MQNLRGQIACLGPPVLVADLYLELLHSHIGGAALRGLRGLWDRYFLLD
jgi:hypothetical protein